MIVKHDKNTLNKSGKRVSSTRVLVKCDDCGSEKWGRWNNYKDKEHETHRCLSCRNKAGENGCKGKQLSDEFKRQAAERLRQNNPMHKQKNRDAARERMNKFYEEGGINYWYGKKRPEHAEAMKEYMSQLFSKDSINPELKKKYLYNLRRQSQFQRDVKSSLDINGYNFEVEYEIYDENDNLLYVVDLFDPKTNTCVSCNGDYFHARQSSYSDDEMIFGKTAKEIRAKDAEKTKLLKENGIKQIVIWYTDWKKNKNIIDYDWKSVLGY